MMPGINAKPVGNTAAMNVFMKGQEYAGDACTKG
jgi:hypothetical protein